MERIEQILRRMQELYYSRHEKTGIDIDLMLDYTRVMYADLLEWRKRFKDEPAAATAVPESAATATERDAAEEKEAAAPQPAPQPRKETPEPAAEKEAAVPGPEKEQAEAGVVQEVLHNNTSAISFEPPAAHTSHPEQIDEVLVEEEPEVNTPIENIVLPEVEPEAQEPPVATAAQTGSGPVLRKDIRGSIGINDKYLFLNELFDNNKTDYDETLDQLRLFDDYEQAYHWLQEHPARKHSWEEGDDTVQVFLGLVSQYLSSK